MTDLAQALKRAHVVLAGMPEPVCQFNHVTTYCTRTVTVAVTNCKGLAMLICANGGYAFDGMIARNAFTCVHCGRPVAECTHTTTV